MYRMGPLGCFVQMFCYIALGVIWFFWPLSLHGFWKLTEIPWIFIAIILGGKIASVAKGN